MLPALQLLRKYVKHSCQRKPSGTEEDWARRGSLSHPWFLAVWPPTVVVVIAVVAALPQMDIIASKKKRETEREREREREGENSSKIKLGALDR